MNGEYGSGSLSGRLCVIREKLRECEKNCGRKEGSVTLLAAVKYASPEQITELASLGLNDMGENRVDKFESDLALLSGFPSVRMHFIGTLQTRKAARVAGKTVLIHSLDSHKLADAIEKASASLGTVSRLLIEINSDREESKGGVWPEDASALAAYVSTLPHISFDGFMTMGRAGLSQDGYYNLFSRTASLANEIWKDLGREGKPYLSMGMSESFEAAVAAGSDCVRLGRILFGAP